MVIQWIGGIILALAGLAQDMDQATVSQVHLHVWAAIFLGGNQFLPDCDGMVAPWEHPVTSSRDRSRTDVLVGNVDSSDRRPDRDSFSRVWFTGIFSFLSGLASDHDGDTRRRGGSLFARNLVASIRVWCPRRKSLSLDRTRGMGCL